MIALESKGFVKRTRRASDRRSVDLEVTPSGLELIEKDPMGLVLEAASRLSRDDCEAMNAALGQLVENLQRSIGLPEFGPCFDCVHFREERVAPEAQTVCRCALTQDVLPPHDLHRVCTSFESFA